VEGYILLQFLPQVLQTVSGKDIAKEAWDELAKVFSIVSPLQIFVSFCKAITYRIQAHEPAPDILEIAKAFGHLTAAKVEIPSIIQAMTLLSALPTEFKHITQTYLQVTTLNDFKFTEIQEGILTEFAWKQNKGLKQIQKLLNVKCKGDNPRWEPHANKDRQNDQKGDCQSKKQHSDQQQKPAQHSHMASWTEILQPPQSFTFVNGWGSIIEPSMAHIEEVVPT